MDEKERNSKHLHIPWSIIRDITGSEVDASSTVRDLDAMRV